MTRAVLTFIAGTPILNKFDNLQNYLKFVERERDFAKANGRKVFHASKRRTDLEIMFGYPTDAPFPHELLKAARATLASIKRSWR